MDTMDFFFGDLPDGEKSFLFNILFPINGTGSKGKKPEFAWMGASSPEWSQDYTVSQASLCQTPESKSGGRDTYLNCSQNVYKASTDNVTHSGAISFTSQNASAHYVGENGHSSNAYTNHAFQNTSSHNVYAQKELQERTVNLDSNVNNQGTDTVYSDRQTEKSLPRRNKKKRPPGYYDQLETQGQPIQSPSYATQDPSGQGVYNVQDERTVLNQYVGQESNTLLPDHVSDYNNQHFIYTSSQSGVYSASTSCEVAANSDNAQVAVSNQFQMSTQDPNRSQLSIDAQQSMVPSQPLVLSTEQTLDTHMNTETIPATQDKPESAESAFTSNTTSVSTDAPTGECPAQNTVETTKAAPKPSSWAALFSGSAPAKNATVVYTAPLKEEQKESASNKDAAPSNTTPAALASIAAPSVVPVSQDAAAGVLAVHLAEMSLRNTMPSLVPRGLTNVKNWCYVNATLQALLACPAFCSLLRSLPSMSDRQPSSTPLTDALVSFANEFSVMQGRSDTKALNAKGTMKIDVPQGPAFEPTNIYSVLKLEKYASTFMLGRQEDAEEFLGCLLNGVHDELVAALSLRNQPTPDCGTAEDEVPNGEEEGAEEEREGDGWAQVGPKNKAVVTRTTSSKRSPISDIFQGKFRSILQQSGQRESACLEPFFTLQLDIQSPLVQCVTDALDNLVRKESLQGFTCTKTKQEVEAWRRLALEDLPEVLVLHLKYFIYDKYGGSKKLTKHVDFPLDLEISKELLSSNSRAKLTANQRKYKLFAVVCHHGVRMFGGHYTAYVYHAGLGTWLHFDDELVRSVQPASILKHNPPKVPYLLYYRRQDEA